MYSKHFRHADDIVNHLNGVMPDVKYPLLEPKYVGFVSVAAVSVYELAIKDIFIEFARNKHEVFGNFTESYFDRIHGRIKIETIKNEYIRRFGHKYKDQFEKDFEKKEHEYLRENRRNIRKSYENIITWRNAFAHASNMNSTTTYKEVVEAYEDGKEVIHCLAESMTR